MAHGTQVGKTFFFKDQDLVVPADTITPILVETNTKAPFGRTLLIDTIVGTGNADAEWFILFNSVEIMRYRTSEQDRTMKLEFPVGILFDLSDSIEVRACHGRTGNREFHVSVVARQPS